MFFSQCSIVRFHHFFHQLQRLLPSTRFAACECKASGHVLAIFAYITNMKNSIIPTAEASIYMWHKGFPESVVYRFKGLRY